ncbi:MAG: hypothetical protein R6U66_01285 [Bacteroidales bacterium]|jgi:hypothetical protein
MYKTVTIHTRSTYWTNRDSNDEMLVDTDDLSEEIQTACNKLYKEGYEVVQITPISSGNIEHGTGYFQTESVLITAKKVH